MDRNDDFINMDKLFQGLNHAEEKEPVGAWDKMEGILNIEMPIKANSTRKFGFWLPVAALLLVVGSAFYIWNKQDSKMNINTIDTATYELNKTNQNKKVAAKFENKEKDTPTKSTKSTLNLNAVEKGIHSKKGEIPTNKQLLASTSKTIPSSLDSKFEKKNTQIPDLKPSKINQPKSISENTKSQKSIARNKSKITPIIPDSDLVKQPIIEQKVVEVIKGNSEDIKKDLALNSGIPAEKWTPEIPFKNKKIVGNQHGQFFEKEKEEFERIDLTKKQVIQNQNHKRVNTIIDTVSIAKIQQIKYTPLSKMETYQVNQLLYASTAPIMESVNATELANLSASTSNFLVPLSNYKVKSKKVNTLDFIKNTADGINTLFDGTHKFSAGLLLGGNASIGNQNAYGMQIGLVGNYALAERWTLSAEFKFINKYFPSFNYQDDENNYNVTKKQENNGWLFTGTGTTTSNNYAFKNINSLNLPVYLGYNLTDRMAVIAGVNFNYYLPLQYSKVNSLNTYDINELSSSPENTFHDNSFKLNDNKDFKSRIGVGYLVGLNYEFSRRYSLDCRVTQSLWNNRNLNISTLDNVYSNPSFELSLGIFFGRRQKVVYIMEKR